MKTRISKRIIGWTSATTLLVALGVVGWIQLLPHADCARSPSGTDAATIVAAEQADASTRVARVRTIRPSREHLKRTTTQPASVDPYERTDIFAKAAGYVERVDVDIGDRVSKDQVLAELWIPEMRQEHQQKKALLDEAKAKVAQANAARQAAQAMIQAAVAKREESQSLLARYEAEIAYRKSEYGRLQRLLNDRAVQRDQVDEKLSQLQAAQAALASAEAAVRSAEANLRVEQAKLVQAESDLTAAQSRVAVAEANLKQTEILLAYGTIKTPYEGMITSRHVDTGAFIQSAAAGRTDSLFSVVRTDRLRIVANVPETDAAWVQVGQPALLEVNAIKGRQFPGRVARLSGRLDESTRTMRAEVELTAPHQGLLPGMFGSVTITLGNFPDAVMLPANAITSATGKPFVFCVEDGRVVRRNVAVGLNDGVRVQVMAGLTGDEDVITDGRNLVHEGQAVKIME
jgi:RND family efflux transporter MFP subunit